MPQPRPPQKSLVLACIWGEASHSTSQKVLYLSRDTYRTVLWPAGYSTVLSSTYAMLSDTSPFMPNTYLRT